MPHILFQSIPRLLLPKLRWTWWSHHCPSKTLQKSASLWQWAPCTQQGVCDSWATLLAAAQPMLMSHKQPQRACRMWSVQSMFKRKAPLALWKVQWSYRFLQSLDAIYQTSSKLRKSAEATVGWCSVGQMYIYMSVHGSGSLQKFKSSKTWNSKRKFCRTSWLPDLLGNCDHGFSFCYDCGLNRNKGSLYSEKQRRETQALTKPHVGVLNKHWKTQNRTSNQYYTTQY